MASDPASLQEKFAQLRAGYLERLPAVMAELETLADGRLDLDALDELGRRLHKLAGSAGTFGLPALSERALELELRIRDWSESTLSDPQAQADLARDVAGLRAAARGSPAAELDAPSVSEAPPPERGARLWVVEDDPALGDELTRQLDSFGFGVRLFRTARELAEAARADRPDLLLWDLASWGESAAPEGDADEGLGLPAARCPVVCFSADDDFASRVRAVRLGASAFFVKPLDVPRLVNRVGRILEQRRAAPQRVLIVEDDRELAARYRLVLLAAGMEAEVLEAPEAIIDTVTAFRPDLVLMDLHMPRFSGADLAGVIRQHDNWSGLPIVYLSTETDLDRQVGAMDLGGDDFLTKPIADRQLVATLRSRIERARQLAEQITQDGLTGLLKHASIKEAAEHEVSRSLRTGKPVTLAILDIDRFKQVNDSFGHAAGDVVISAVAMLLRQRLRQSDIVGRYGGDEFVIVLPDCSVQSAHRLLEEVVGHFAGIRFSHGDAEFICTLSVGLACSLDHRCARAGALLAAADHALYEAKREGRNRVRISLPK